MKDEIANKLTDFLDRLKIFTEECQVVYTLVELRKLLDHYGSNARLVRFYCDWAVHISKDRITKEIEAVSAAMLQEAAAKINAPHPLAVDDTEIANFAYGDALASELEQFLREVQIPLHIVTVEETWNSFVRLLVKVLENQPLVKPCAGVDKIFFVPSAANAVILRIDFTNRISGYTHYRFMSNLPD